MRFRLTEERIPDAPLTPGQVIKVALDNGWERSGRFLGFMHDPDAPAIKLFSDDVEVRAPLPAVIHAA